MLHTKQKGMAPFSSATPMLHDEAERCAALVQAAVLEGGELEGSRQQQWSRPEHPRVRLQPLDVLKGFVQEPIGHMGGDTEGQPHTEIAGDDQCYQPPLVGTARGQATKHLQQRQCGRQHHRHRHQGPAGDVEDRRRNDVCPF